MSSVVVANIEHDLAIVKHTHNCVLCKTRLETVTSKIARQVLVKLIIWTKQQNQLNKPIGRTGLHDGPPDERERTYREEEAKSESMLNEIWHEGNPLSHEVFVNCVDIASCFSSTPRSPD